MINVDFTTSFEEKSPYEGVFVIGPLQQSFGHSLGNALRRTLLSSLFGVAADYVKVEGADHLFSTLKGVRESVLEIVLNIKKLRFVLADDAKEAKVKLSVKGKGILTGGDFKGDAEVVNKDLYIAEVVDDQANFEIEVLVKKDAGYKLAEEKEKKNGYIAVDSFFSPVTKVNYKVRNVRVADKADHEEIIMNIETDGSISPKDALKAASNMLSEYFSYVLVKEGNILDSVRKDESVVENQVEKGSDIITDELALPSRVINALLKEDIETVADLVSRGKAALAKLKGVGKKSVELIEEELKRHGIELK